MNFLNRFGILNNGRNGFRFPDSVLYKFKHNFYVPMPTPPKKPSNSYCFFVKDLRRELLKHNPDLTGRELIKAGSARWKTLDSKQKETYKEQWKEYSAQYEMMYANYLSSLTDEQRESLLNLRKDKLQLKIKKQVKKELNYPKRPSQAFAMFLKHHSEERKSLHFREFFSQLADRWKKLEPSEKELFKKKAEADKERFEEELETLKKSLKLEGKEELFNTMVPVSKRIKHSEMPKDPTQLYKKLNGPKKPSNSFLIFSHSHFGERGSTPFQVFLKDLSKRWKSLTPSEKKLYETKAIADKERYEEELEAWKEQMKSDGKEQLLSTMLPFTVKKRSKKKPQDES